MRRNPLDSICNDLEGLGEDIRLFLADLANRHGNQLRQRLEGVLREGERCCTRTVRRWAIRRYRNELILTGCGAAGLLAAVWMLARRR
jgi:type II secretory pathway component PulM